MKHIDIERTDAWLDHDVSFIEMYGSHREFMALRRTNLSVTSMVWIPCRLRMTDFDELYNPKTPILIWLN